jgi:site-specific recombinase XerD
MLYPADPPRVELIAVMRQAGDDRGGLRVRALIAVLWRAGLRISEALALRAAARMVGAGVELQHRQQTRSARKPGRAC